MPLNNTTADILAEQISAALGVTDAESIAKYKLVYRLVYEALKTDAQVIVPTGSINTTGTAAAQSGPTAPVTLTVT